jgi:hypothetical protein
MTRFALSPWRTLAALAMLAVSSLAGPSCGGGGDVGAVCDAVCECTGCSDSERDDCEDDGEDILQEAEAAGCEDEADAYLECVEDELECKDDRIHVDGCEVVSEELEECMDDVPIGVGGTACDAAVDRLEECGLGSGEPGGEAECEGAVRCAAQCIADADCDDINNPTSDSAYVACVSGCQG